MMGFRRLAVLTLAAIGCAGWSVSGHGAATHRGQTVALNGPLTVPLTAPVTRAPTTSAATRAQTTGIDQLTIVARRRYDIEQYGPAVHDLLRRVAADPGLQAAVRSGSTAAIRAAVAAKFDSVWYHWHVSRLRIVRHGKVVADAGVPFVVAPSSWPLRDAHGRVLATLEISDQDVIGFVRFMHRNHGVDVVVRGVGPAHVRSSLPAALRLALPDHGQATIAGRRYHVRSFTKKALSNEPVKIWILLPV
ncbi:MAG: hypothetical protein JWO02_3110 [Solirubrobacterales bacterium]|nr:hypothetical protein [Solirubrobacterales bacterium]